MSSGRDSKTRSSWVLYVWTCLSLFSAPFSIPPSLSSFLHPSFLLLSLSFSNCPSFSSSLPPSLLLSFFFHHSFLLSLPPSLLFSFSVPGLSFFPSLDIYSSLFYYCCGKTLLQKATWGGKMFIFAYTYRWQPIPGVSLGKKHGGVPTPGLPTLWLSLCWLSYTSQDHLGTVLSTLGWAP